MAVNCHSHPYAVSQLLQCLKLNKQTNKNENKAILYPSNFLSLLFPPSLPSFLSLHSFLPFFLPVFLHFFFFWKNISSLQFPSPLANSFVILFMEHFVIHWISYLNKNSYVPVPPPRTSECNLIWKQCCCKCSYLRSYWSRLDPLSNKTGVLKKGGHLDTHTHTHTHTGNSM